MTLRVRLSEHRDQYHMEAVDPGAIFEYDDTIYLSEMLYTRYKYALALWNNVQREIKEALDGPGDH